MPGATPVTTAEATMTDVLEKAQGELSQLGRVSHRLAMTDEGPNLVKVLNLLLPRLLSRVGSNRRRTMEISRSWSVATDTSSEQQLKLKELYDKIHAKLVETLSHTMKRVRADASCQIPCLAVLKLLSDSETKMPLSPAKVDAFTLNLSLAFLTMGLPRCTIEEVESLLPELISLFGAHSSNSGIDALLSPVRKMQHNQCAHLVLRALETVVMGNGRTGTRPPSTRTATGHVPPKAPLGSKSTPVADKMTDVREGYLREARRVCRDSVAGAAVFELVLDALLFQPVAGNSNLPPPGLSEAGHKRLISGASTAAANWGAEFASVARLRELKLHMLDLIAPSRRWSLFLSEIRDDNDETLSNDEISNDNQGSRGDEGIGAARTVALLVSASGSEHQDVAERARSYLKAHMDSLRNVTRNDLASTIISTRSPPIEGSTGKAEMPLHHHPLLGNPIILTVRLLSLCLGDSVAQSILLKCTTSSPGILSRNIGMVPYTIDNSSQASIRAAFMTTKRRLVADKTSTEIQTFVSVQIFSGLPKIFAFSSGDGIESLLSSASTLVSMSLASATNNLDFRGGLVGNASGKSRVAAAKLMNSLSVRLATLYDALSDSSPDSLGEIHDLLAKVFALSCSVLKASASPHTSMSGTQDGVETKDSCYGVICTLSRSAVAKSSRGMIFDCGNIASGSFPAKKRFSISTATLLFGCASHEEETLRPRATAALDAVLAAYTRHLQVQQNIREGPITTDHSTNPWVAVPQNEPEDSTESSLISAFDLDALARSLLPLLWSAARGSQPKASRLAAAQWATDLVKPLDLTNACHILCYLAGDSDVTASSVAKVGLGVSEVQKDEDILHLSSDGKSVLPDFQQFVTSVFEGKRDSKVAIYEDFSPAGASAALRFGLMCLLDDLYGGEDSGLNGYLNAILSTLLDVSSTSLGVGSGRGREALDLMDSCSFCLAGVLRSSAFARHSTANNSNVNHMFLSNLSIAAASSKSRRLLAESCGYLYEDMEFWKDHIAGSVYTAESFASASGVDRILAICASKLNGMRQDLFMSGEIHGAAFLGARCVRAFRKYTRGLARFGSPDQSHTILGPCLDASGDIIAALGHGTLHSDALVANACSHGLAIAFSYDEVDAPLLELSLYPGTAKALSDLILAMKKYGNGDNTDPARATLLAMAAGSTLAASTSGAGSGATGQAGDEVTANASLGRKRLQIVHSLFDLLGSMSFRKDPEISIVVGEALAQYADAYSPDGSVWSSLAEEEPDDFDESFAEGLPPHKHVLYILLRREAIATNPHKVIASSPALLALVGHAAGMMNRDRGFASRNFLKEVCSRLVDIQATFVRLLSYPKNKQLGRESCCLGLSACYGLANASSLTNQDTLGLNSRLIAAFGATTNYGSSAMQETASQHRERLSQENRDGDAGVGAAAAMMEDFGMETEIGGASGMSEATLGAYREMAAASVSLERPDILYSLMLLSTSHPIWTSPGYQDRYNANSLIGDAMGDAGRNIKEIQDALRPHLGKLTPRLLRACNDPKKETRNQMTALWTGLTGGGADSRAAIDAHLLTTIDSLIDDASNKLWRARVGACGALGDVIVGRSWKELGGGGAVMDDDDMIPHNDIGGNTTAGIRLLRLLRVTTRSMDDVRLKVRESGESLGRSVRALIISLCDPKEESLKGDIFLGGNTAIIAQMESDTKAAAATALRWLVKHGLNQPAPEATGFCISILLGVTDVAKHSTLQPVLPELIYSLLMAMSGLEPQALNYLQVRASGNESVNGAPGSYDQLERVRLQLAQSGPIASALTKCLGMVRFLDQDSQKHIIPHLDAALRCGAGFATRAAVADAVTSLCSTSPNAFRSLGHPSTNPTVRLLRALYFASEREKGAGARDKMAHALGSVAELAPRKSVRLLAIRACERYRSSLGGSNNDPSTRQAAAAALRSIAVRASNQFSDGGKNDIWCRQILPLAFLGRKDEEKRIASLWNDVWDEGGTVANSAGKSDNVGVLLEEKLLPGLVREIISALDDVSWSRRVIACEAVIDLADSSVLAPAPRLLQDKHGHSSSNTFQGREQRRAQASSAVLTSCTRLITKSRVWDGKKEVIKAASKVAAKWSVSCGISTGAKRNARVRVDTENCSWSPLIQDTSDWNNLFLGDNWFSLLSESDSGEEDLNVTHRRNEKIGDEIVNQDREEPLDFAEEEKVLGLDHRTTNISIASDDERDDAPALRDILTFSGLCHLFQFQGLSPTAWGTSINEENILPYRAAALQALSEVLQSLTTPTSGDMASLHARFIYASLSPKLLSSILERDPKPQPPLIVARCLMCLSSAMWYGMGDKLSEDRKEESIVNLSNVFLELCGGKQPAWTVREAAALAASSLAQKSAFGPICKHSTISTLIECTVQTQRDRKFWRCRLAGQNILLSLIKRAGSTNDVTSASDEKQLVLEALLPEKERILKIAKESLKDNEAKVTALAAEICGALSWWP